MISMAKTKLGLAAVIGPASQGRGRGMMPLLTRSLESRGQVDVGFGKFNHTGDACARLG